MVVFIWFYCFLYVFLGGNIDFLIVCEKVEMLLIIWCFKFEVFFFIFVVDGDVFILI